MEFADYAIYGDDTDHRIDLRNPHFRQEPIRIHSHEVYPPQHRTFAHHLAGLDVDVKPRLTKEQHDILEAHYQKQNKPNTQTKKEFADALGVSLDKVNNWFQNRRAKSKQDAKKAAGQNPEQQEQNSQTRSDATNTHTDDVSVQFLSSDCLSDLSDSAVHVDPMSLENALGICTSDDPASSLAEPRTVSPAEMMNNPPVRVDSKDEDHEMEVHRRTMTQEQFDFFAQVTDYTTTQPPPCPIIEQSPAQSTNSSVLNDYFPEASEFNLETLMSPGSIGSPGMQPAFSTDSGGTSTASHAFTGSTNASPSALARNASTQSSVSDWSENSNQLFNAASSNLLLDSSDSEISPRSKKVPKQTEQWQPGTSIPVDFTTMDREFREAAMRSASQSANGGHAQAGNISQVVEQPLAFPNDQAYPPGVPETSLGLANSINNLGISTDDAAQSQHGTVRAPSSSGSIAARRQRPRPMPLTSGSLRSTSYCGSLPTAPGLGGGNGHNSGALTPGGMPTLRRIKSSLAMNGGIANGRIQKNIGIAQRSPLNFSFAEAVNSPKFARNVSSAAYTPTGSSHGRLHPSSSSGGLRGDAQRQWAQIQGAQHMSRQPSINETIETPTAQMVEATGGLGLSGFSSPPTTPLYPAQYARNRFADNTMMSEHTPPQSAPPTQQCFQNSMYPQGGSMQVPRAQIMPVQQQTFVPMMANEYPLMPNVVVSSQQMPSGQLVDLAQHYAAMGFMGNQPPPTQFGYVPTPYTQAYNQHVLTPSHHQFSMPVGSPGAAMMSPQAQMHAHAQAQQHMKAPPQADFFVHEYSPPQDMKQARTPRKHQELGPRSYTFANHGPEHFEKGGRASKGNDAVTTSPHAFDE